MVLLQATFGGPPMPLRRASVTKRVTRVQCNLGSPTEGELDSLKSEISNAKKGENFILAMGDFEAREPLEVLKTCSHLEKMAKFSSLTIKKPITRILKTGKQRWDENDLKGLGAVKNVLNQMGVSSNSSYFDDMFDKSLDFKPVFTGRKYTDRDTEMKFTTENLNRASHVLYCEVENMGPSDFEYLRHVKNVKVVKVTETTRLDKFGEACQQLNPQEKHGELLIELSYYPESWDLLNFLKKVKKQGVEATWLVNPFVPVLGKKGQHGPRAWDPVKCGVFIRQILREFASEREIISGIDLDVSAKAFRKGSSTVLPLDQHQATLLIMMYYSALSDGKLM